MASVESATVHTVLGPIPAHELGVVAIHESLLGVLPGAQYAYDIPMDRSEIFGLLAARLAAFRAAGGGTIVDSTGMFSGRDLPMYEALSRSTGVHIIASTGLGPEELLGGYFLTPQTNPPTPWPAEKFTELFAAEVREGMVVPRLERHAPAGVVATAAERGGMTATEESLFRAAARTALLTGVPASIRFGADPLHDLDIVLDEGLPADRIIVGDLDRVDAVAAGAPRAVAERGAYVALDHVGWNDGSDVINDDERIALLLALIDAGLADHVLLSSNAIGVAKGLPACEVPFETVLTSFVPLAKSRGLSDRDADRILIENPRALLSVRESMSAAKGA